MQQAQPTPPPEEGHDSLLSMHDNEDDWTANLPQTQHVQFFRSTDWSQTSLGPLKEWHSSLRLFTTLVLADSRPACLWWGPIANLTAIYNAHYAPLAGALHPKLMGSTFMEGYPDLWPSISVYFEEAMRTGSGQNYSSATPLIVERKGWQEEAFFSGSFVPLGVPNQIQGFLNTT